jgi:Carboxypeptidase regulatory-like domain
MRRKPAIATLCFGLVIIVILAHAQQRCSGRVVNRDSAPQAGCEVAFSLDPNRPPTYSVTTDYDGLFYLTNPLQGLYSVTVRRGRQQQTFNVTIGDRGLDPSTLVVNW